MKFYNFNVIAGEYCNMSSSSSNDSEFPYHVWYQNEKGEVINCVRKRTLVDADYFLCRELSGRAVLSTWVGLTGSNPTCVLYFGVEGLIGVAARKP